MLNRISLPAIFLLALLLRLPFLNQSLWLDEATSIVTAQKFSLVEIVTKFSPGDFHPPLYYLLLKAWMQIFGNSEIAARSLSVLFGVLTIATTYKIGQKLFSKYVGYVSALLLAFSPLHIYYSQEARMYSMETFLATLLVWCFVENRWAFFTITGAFLVYTDYLPGLIFIPLFYAAWTQKKTKEFMLSLGVIALATLPWLVIFGQQLQNGLLVRTNAPGWWKVLGKTNLKELILVPVKFIIGRISFYNKYIYAAFVLLGLFLYEIPLRRSLINWKKSQILWICLVVPLGLAALMGLRVSVFSYFRLIFLLPIFYLLVAYGLTLAEKKYRNIILSSLLIFSGICVSIYFVNPRFHRENWKEAVVWIEKDPQNAATIFVTNNQRDPYLYYCCVASSRNDSKVLPSGSYPAERGKVLPYGPNGLAQGNFETIYLMRYVQPIFDPEDKVRKTVEAEGYKKTQEQDFNGVVVWKYKK